MFGAVTKLFDSNFAVGYFLPSTIFLVANLILWWPDLGIAAALADSDSLLQENLVLLLGLMALACWLLAVSLLAANRRLIDVKSGYGLLNFERSPFLQWQLSCFDELQEKNKQLEDEKKCANVPADPIASAYDFARRYPSERQCVLPFAFGNSLCASESYANEMYGFDAITGWQRLLTVIPVDYRTLLDASKAQMDFLVNLWLLSLLFLAETIVHLTLDQHRLSSAMFCLAAGASALLASHWSLKAADEWGELSKTAYDVYLPALREKLGLARPRTRADEREQWQSFSRAIAYHEVGCLPEPPPPAETTAQDVAEPSAGLSRQAELPASGRTGEGPSLQSL